VAACVRCGPKRGRRTFPTQDGLRKGSPCDVLAMAVQGQVDTPEREHGAALPSGGLKERIHIHRAAGHSGGPGPTVPVHAALGSTGLPAGTSAGEAGGGVIFLNRGVQQGDPLGPLLFAAG